ncbi:hypothetical protein P8S55_08450 [Halomonas sp. M1]|uniref:hypothetical protein n=1 Tax=Halomonas sp. M1 TaxID=3035470 RepID=UPI0024853289|nr:hypothetical protein [Halomonas sp. M1]WFE73115.1 hypothetical protein P8S55_08450 [Halomonas sp. M1]
MLDVIGTLYYQEAVFDDDGSVVSPAVPLAGFHINSAQELSNVDEYRITPDVPQRVFKGGLTYYYRFDSQQQAKSLLHYDESTGLYSPKVVHVQPVPDAVTSRQGMEQLIRSGLDEQVDDAINGITDPVERKLARNWLDKASIWERNNPQLLAIGNALGLSKQDVDSLFIQAGGL